MDVLVHLLVDFQDLGDEVGEEVAKGIFLALVWQNDLVDQVGFKLCEVKAVGPTLIHASCSS